MKKSKFIIIVFVAIAVLAAQVGSVFAAPALQDGTITGKVTALKCGTDGKGNTIILVTLEGTEGKTKTVGISVESAKELGLVTVGEGDVPDCSEEAFKAILDAAPEGGLVVDIATEEVVPVKIHPVGNALANFFSEFADYAAIMEAHENGTGFGVIAQALWMTKKLVGDSEELVASEVFASIIDAKKSGGEFTFGDETYPNWGQFKKAIFNGEKKQNLGAIMSDKNKDNGGDDHGNAKDKSNNGNGNNKDEDKNKNKTK